MVRITLFILSIGGFLLIQSCQNSTSTLNKTEDSSYDSGWDAAANWNEREEGRKGNRQIAGEKTVIPNWVVQLYKDSGSLYEKTGYELVYFKKINDSISYCIYNVFSGTCGVSYLATQVNQRPLENLQVSEGCDADLSIPSYSYSDYSLDSSRYVIITTEYSEEAKKEFLTDDGRSYKQGFDDENSEKIRDTIKTIRKIEPSGKVTSWEIKKHN